MSDMHLHHDLYHEAASRRSRETDSWVRDQAHRRSAKRAETRKAGPGARVRFVTLMARAMGVAGEIATTASEPSRQATADKHAG